LDFDFFIHTAVKWAKWPMEITAVCLVLTGAVLSIIELLKSWFKLNHYFEVRQLFSRYLILALEFQLAADILGTTVSPSWDQIGKLGAIAVIRTLLNYFLSLELQQDEKNQIN
jgi:uncharacterized membrane protein